MSKKVIIIGAPRSGTNMLRDLLCSVDGIATWPCDEINYVWRYGNVRYPTDQLTSQHATPRVVSYITRQFDWVARRYDADTVVEKTCANSLRVNFVHKVIPDARFIFIYRNGIDVTSSALIRWKAKLDIAYTLQKLRFVPIADIPYYGLKYFKNRLSRLRSKEGALASWGPRYAGMEEYRTNNDLLGLCASQWQQCVESSIAALETIPDEKVFRISYEELVKNKHEHVGRLAEFVECDPERMLESPFVKRVSSAGVGKGYKSIDPAQVDRIVKIVGPTLKRLGYR